MRKDKIQTAVRKRQKCYTSVIPHSCWSEKHTDDKIQLSVHDHQPRAAAGRAEEQEAMGCLTSCFQWCRNTFQAAKLRGKSIVIMEELCSDHVSLTQQLESFGVTHKLRVLLRGPTSLPAPLTLELHSGPYLQYTVKWHCEYSFKSKQLLRMSCSLGSNFHLDKEFQLLGFNYVCNLHSSFSWKLDIVVWGGETPRELKFFCLVFGFGGFFVFHWTCWELQCWDLSN